MNLVRWHWFGLLIVFGLTSCTRELPPFAEPEYPAKIVGEWLGTVGDTKEAMSFEADGNFVAQVRPSGFISNTLSQGVTGTIRGTWTITGKVITMRITSSDNERLQNRTTSSTIVTFRQNELVVRSMSGETSTFTRGV